MSMTSQTVSSIVYLKCIFIEPDSLRVNCKRFLRSDHMKIKLLTQLILMSSDCGILQPDLFLILPWFTHASEMHNWADLLRVINGLCHAERGALLERRQAGKGPFVKAGRGTRSTLLSKMPPLPWTVQSTGCQIRGGVYLSRISQMHNSHLISCATQPSQAHIRCQLQKKIHTS